MPLLKVLLSLLILYHCSSAADDVKDDTDSGASDPGALWFGPRLGKRSLKLSNDDNRQTFLRLLEAADALKFYYDQLPYYTQPDEQETRVTKKVIFTPKLGRRNLYQEKRLDVDFTPRLGRRLSYNLVTPPEQESYQHDPEQIDARTKLFSPRLGRTVNFSPRLGREIAYDIYPENIRLTRSTNTTKSAQ